MIEVEHLAKSFVAKSAGTKAFGGWRRDFGRATTHAQSAAPHESRVHAVRDVSFAAADGRVTGLLGPNGAGKTTTLRMIGTLVLPDGGHARVDGHDCVAQPIEVRERLGVLSDARGLYVRMTARENIRYYGRLRAMDDDRIESAIDRLAELLEMRPILDRRTDGFSQGRADEGCDRAGAGARPAKPDARRAEQRSRHQRDARAARADPAATRRRQVHRDVESHHAGSDGAGRPHRDRRRGKDGPPTARPSR